MGAVIVKVAPDDPRYVRWSSIVDAATHVFEDRDDVRSYLMDDYSPNDIRDRQDAAAHFGGKSVEQEVEERLDWTDETGTSGRRLASSQFRFDAAPDDLINFMGLCLIHRSNLSKVMDLVYAEDNDGDFKAHHKALNAAGIAIPFDDD